MSMLSVLSAEQVEACRTILKGGADEPHPDEMFPIDALCDLALRALSQPPDSEAERLREERDALLGCVEAFLKVLKSTEAIQPNRIYRGEFQASSIRARLFLSRMGAARTRCASQPAALCKRCKGAGEFDAFVKSPFEQDGEMRSVQCPDCNGDGVRQPAAREPKGQSYNDGLEAAAKIVDECNRSGPYDAIGAATKIRAMLRASEPTEGCA